MPYLITNNSTKPRVVNDDEAMSEVVSLNQAVWAGKNLLE